MTSRATAVKFLICIFIPAACGTSNDETAPNVTYNEPHRLFAFLFPLRAGPQTMRRLLMSPTMNPIAPKYIFRPLLNG